MFTVRMPRAQRASARLAIAFALFLAVAEVARNWGDWSDWPFWLVDYLAVTLLLVGASRSLRAREASLWLAGGWGFSCAMFYMSFFSHLAELRADPNAPEHGLLEARPLTVAIGVLFALTIVGFALSLLPDRRRGR
jgi:hypothetical protein